MDRRVRGGIEWYCLCHEDRVHENSGSTRVSSLLEHSKVDDRITWSLALGSECGLRSGHPWPYGVRRHALWPQSPALGTSGEAGCVLAVGSSMPS